MKWISFRFYRQILSALMGGDPSKGMSKAEKWGRWVVLIVLIAVTAIIISPFFYFEQVKLEPGRRTFRGVRAQIPFVYEDPQERARWERERDESYRHVYLFDHGVHEEASKRLEALKKSLQKMDLPDSDDFSTATLGKISKDLRKLTVPGENARGLVLSEQTVSTLLKRKDSHVYWETLQGFIDSIYKRGVLIAEEKARFERHVEDHRAIIKTESDNTMPLDMFHDALEYPKGLQSSLANNLRGYFPGESENLLDSPRKAALELLVYGLITPNLKYDLDKSRLNHLMYTEGLERIQNRVEANEVLLARGDRLRDKDLPLIQAYNKALQRYALLRLIGNTAFVALVTSIIGFYVFRFRSNFTFDIHSTLLTGLPLIAVLLIGRVLLVVMEETHLTDLGGYSFPSGTIGMLGVLLLDARLALLLVTWGCLLFGLQVNLDFRYAAVALIGGYTAVATLLTIRERRDVVAAGAIIGLVNGVSILVIHFIADPGMIPWRLSAVGFINGVACSLLTIALLPVFEFLFGAVTDIRLLELTGLEHPLTARLENETPGTWQHSLNVSKLAESGARAIGVNQLLVRAGAYFHDIGKMRKPAYFSENQVTPEDKRRHQELRPQMSVLIIRDHVKSGHEMALESGLPQKIVEFIPQHHGTSLIKYFYHKALKEYEAGKTKAPVREEDYRYPGPKPQSRETALLMLADSVEATATAKLNGPHIREDDIRIIVRDTILDKFNDGQFDDCDLTFQDLQKIRESFVIQLLSRFHTRIDYPKLPEKHTDHSKLSEK